MTKLTENQIYVLKTIAVHSDGVERGIYIRDITNPVDLTIKDFKAQTIANFCELHIVAVRGILHNLEQKGLIFIIKGRRSKRTALHFTEVGYEVVKRLFPPL